MRASRVEDGFPWAGLLTLAGAIFIAVTSEFLPTALLPEMSQGLNVPPSSIGLLVTVFAGTVVVSTAPLATFTRRLQRKGLIIAVLGTFAVSNFLGAISPTYEFMLASRVLGGFSHGLFWAVVGAYPAHLVAKRQLTRAVAITSAGASAAFVLGVPAGTALGHALGWRLAFTAVGAAVLVLAVLVFAFLPAVNHHQPLRTGEIPLPLRKDPSLAGVLIVCSIAMLLMIGHNLYYTFIVPFFSEINGFPSDSVAVLLLVFGAAGAGGLLLVGLFGGRSPRAALVLSVMLIALAVLSMGLFPGYPVIVVATLVVWGAAFGGAPALLQTRVLHIASPKIRDVAAALMTTSFNFGIGAGALIGSLMLDGWGLRVLPFSDLAVVILVLILILVTDVYLRRRKVRGVGKAAIGPVGSGETV